MTTMLRVLLVLLPMVAFVLTQSWWFIALFLVLLVWMVGSAVRRPTDKMVGYAISIAQENGVPPPNLRSFREVRKFLNKHGHYRLPF
ncbi:hypothetical protein D7S55_23995 [Ralstonia pickettii]|jgi:hypothetical protein|nr:hypothetical protein [Ralstonia pickettii]MBA9853407.1 hypothetical protein [Ralstonia pickettii]MBA9920962.1 hypothetical protein [Ralstonia pickettii]MBA9960464.1 hypothetical protein [Ralstonia pickettii]MBA9984410.1 hypothetical protein [Ralstonia pickettii]